MMAAAHRGVGGRGRCPAITLRQFIPFSVLLTVGLAVMLRGDPVRWVETPGGVGIDTTNPTDRWVFDAVLLVFLFRWIHLRTRFDRTGVSAALRNRCATGVMVMTVVNHQALEKGRRIYEAAGMWSGAAWLVFLVFLGWCVAFDQQADRREDPAVPGRE